MTIYEAIEGDVVICDGRDREDVLRRTEEYYAEQGVYEAEIILRTYDDETDSETDEMVLLDMSELIEAGILEMQMARELSSPYLTGRI